MVKRHGFTALQTKHLDQLRDAILRGEKPPQYRVSKRVGK